MESVICVGRSHARVPDWWLPWRNRATYPVAGFFAGAPGRAACAATVPGVAAYMLNQVRRVPGGMPG